MITPEKCPKCGGDYRIETPMAIHYICHSRSWKSGEFTQTQNCIEKQRDQLAERVRELEAWKESAMAVERDWDPNQLATMLGGQLGEPQRAVIQWKVPVLVQRVKRLEEAADKMADAYEEIIFDRHDARILEEYRKVRGEK